MEKRLEISYRHYDSIAEMPTEQKALVEKQKALKETAPKKKAKDAEEAPAAEENA